jgi:hypothetical protein
VSKRLSLLQDIRVATPCPARWSAMDGDDRRRFCGQCQKHVYDFSRMREREIVSLLDRDHVCGRLHRRADGTILTADCPTGLRLARQRFVRLATRAAAFALVLAGATMTAMANVRPQGGDHFLRSSTAKALRRWIDDLHPPPAMVAIGPVRVPVLPATVMGDVAPPAPQPTTLRSAD